MPNEFDNYRDNQLHRHMFRVTKSTSSLFFGGTQKVNAQGAGNATVQVFDQEHLTLSNLEGTATLATRFQGQQDHFRNSEFSTRSPLRLS
jgi:hypothetical protein